MVRKTRSSLRAMSLNEDTTTRLARGTVLLTGNGIALLKAMEFLEAHADQMTMLLRALALGIPLLGLLAAYNLIIRPHTAPKIAYVSVAAIVAEIGLWAGSLSLFGEWS